MNFELSPPSGCRDCLHRHFQQVAPKAGPGCGDHVHQGTQSPPPPTYLFLPPHTLSVGPTEPDEDPSCRHPCSPLRPVSFRRIQATKAARSSISTVTMSLAPSTTLTPLPVRVAWREGEGGEGAWRSLIHDHLPVLPCRELLEPGTPVHSFPAVPRRVSQPGWGTVGCGCTCREGLSKRDRRPAHRQSHSHTDFLTHC